ncbi:SDR family NAD(P)-dependent oxidoreductase [Nocardioides marmoriginsengisoli]|uniref:SDR family NAD(P)-dependent oxidoreductase n=1 Tax=Nocardioides marmoriginsengisoli TaxID=661483 RepID=A0A3N0CI90_9ACTN|nr:SDR family oxidoreductase [Nocardioides marmoriginsengisoli]RNL62736.1 SDR family NAD(P)-dependent oxidoreductase [Nocardioides marmoriginsengisoli]
MPSLHESVVMVTGANGGIGVPLVEEALRRGATKVYATARTPRSNWGNERVIPLRLDVTDPASIKACVEAAGDVSVLVNNAAVSVSTPGILTHSEEEIRANVETNFLGPLFIARAFAPQLAATEGSVLVDIHSVLSWYAVAGIYSATKAALWSVTNSLRLELKPAGVHVVGVHMGYVDTPMAAHTDDPKIDPADFARTVYDGVEAGALEILVDDASRLAKAGLSAPLDAVYPELATH